jgi:ceramide glucosyltransferase
MRPWGHFGLIFTWGLPWSLLAIAVHPSAGITVAYFGTYLVLRIAMTWLMGVWGMKQKRIWQKMPLIPLWDLVAFFIWLASFARKTIRWRGVDYSIKKGMLVRADAASAQSASS